MGDSVKPKATTPTPTGLEDWRKIAARASTETDPDKLLTLVQELCDILEKREAESKRKENP
jgi:benzoyl-CoA reductase/2-hydroxyglutaryl-CoA dehydratase subunit BcrC/BadD/HgdB